MPLTISEVNLILNCYRKCAVPSLTLDVQTTKLAITDAKLYVPVLILSTYDYAKPLEQLKLGFKKTTEWNKYQSKNSCKLKTHILII